MTAELAKRKTPRSQNEGGAPASLKGESGT
jgi:hypothetical protein